MTNVIHTCFILKYIHYILLHVPNIICSEHVEECNEYIVKKRKCASCWSLFKIKLKCTVNKT